MQAKENLEIGDKLEVYSNALCKIKAIADLLVMSHDGTQPSLLNNTIEMTGKMIIDLVNESFITAEGDLE